MSALLKSRADYITQLPPEIITVILQDCANWFKPRTNRGRKVLKYDADECAITRAIIGAVAATCRYFRDIIATISFNYKSAPDAFVLYNSRAFNNLFKIASHDFVKSLLRPRPISQVGIAVSKKRNRISISQPYGLQTGLINHVVSEGPADMLMEIRRMGLLRDYVYNSISFIAQIDKPQTVTYAARYRLIEDVYDLNRNVEGMPPHVAVRVVNNWIRHMYRSKLLQQSDLDRALNLIIRTHPDHAYQVMNFVLRMRAAARSNDPYYNCRFNIDDNELALYAMLRGTTEYSKFLMMRLSIEHRMQILAMLPLAKDKYEAIIFNWELLVCTDLMTIACRRSNHTLARFCKDYRSCFKGPYLQSQIDAIYSRHYCATSGGCCAYSKPAQDVVVGYDFAGVAPLVRDSTAKCDFYSNEVEMHTVHETSYGNGVVTPTTINTVGVAPSTASPTILTSCTGITFSSSNIISDSTSGLCYTSCPPGYNRYSSSTSWGSTTRQATCTCDTVSVMTSCGDTSLRSQAYSSGLGFNQFNLYPGEYQPSGTVNYSRISQFSVPYGGVTTNNDPANKFIRDRCSSNGTRSQTGVTFGQPVSFQIPRYGDLVAYPDVYVPRYSDRDAYTYTPSMIADRFSDMTLNVTFTGVSVRDDNNMINTDNNDNDINPFSIGGLFDD